MYLGVLGNELPPECDVRQRLVRRRYGPLRAVAEDLVDEGVGVVRLRPVFKCDATSVAAGDS